MANEVFISYSRKDIKLAKTIKAEVEESTNAQCWMDLDGGIKSGDPRFIKTITDAIDNCKVFLFLRSAKSQVSDYALLELSYAKDEANCHVVIVSIDNSEWVKEFRFLYRYSDAIDWDNLPQRDKLLRDISDWTEENRLKAEEEARLKAEEEARLKAEEEARLKAEETSKQKGFEGYYFADPVDGHIIHTKTEQEAKSIAEARYKIKKAEIRKKIWKRTGYISAVCAIVAIVIGLFFWLQNEETPFEKTHKAAEGGDVEAQFNLGKMYRDGQGVEQSNEEAAKWFRKAAEQGDLEAQVELAERYFVLDNLEEAEKWFVKAAEQGDADIQCDLGLRYRIGYGVRQSDKEAVKWYRKAAEQGYASAQRHLGWMYENGLGVPQSDYDAADWYILAAEQGDEDALKALRDIKFQLMFDSIDSDRYYNLFE